MPNMSWLIYNELKMIHARERLSRTDARHNHMISKKFIHAVLLATLLLSSGVRAAAIMVDIGNGSGKAGTQGSPVNLVLDNPSDIVKGVQVFICDEGNYLAATSCMATGRASNFLCTFNECRTDAKSAECRRYPGCANVVLYGPGEFIDAGSGPVAVINFDVSESAPSGCVVLNPKKAVVSDQDRKPLSASAERGQFCISGGSSDDTTTSTRPSNTSIPEDEDTETPGDAGNATGTSAGSSGAAASAQAGLRTPMGGSSAASPEISTGSDEEPANSSQTSSRRRITGSGGGVSSGEADRPSAGSSETQNSAAGVAPRLIVSPPRSVIDSKGLLALNAQTITDGKEVQGKYKWEIQPPSAIGSTVDADGIFTAGINPSASPVQETIRVTDTSNKSISATATITIEGAKETPEGCSLLVTPSSAEIAPGNVITFTAAKLGKACGEGSYQWKVSSKIGSSITGEGVYTAGVNRGTEAALDIIMVKDKIEDLHIDALVTVAPADSLSPAAVATPISADGGSGKTGSPLLPGTLIAAAAFVAVVGVLLVRKKK